MSQKQKRRPVRGGVSIDNSLQQPADITTEQAATQQRRASWVERRYALRPSRAQIVAMLAWYRP